MNTPAFQKKNPRTQLINNNAAMMNNVIFIGYDYITDMEKMMPAAPAGQIIYSNKFCVFSLKKQKTG
jgi:hypothetical protein